MRKLENNELDRKSVADFKQADKTPIIIVLDDIRSLNNIGSVFRTADAFLVEKIYLCGITAIPPNKEIHKTALGATETVTWEYKKDILEAIVALKKENVSVFAIEQVENSIYLQDFSVDKDKKYAVVFGNEVFGVNQEAIVESDGGFLLGITPQIKISEGTVFTADFTVLSNVRQHLNWDGSTSAQENNLSGLMYSASLGLTIYLGKNEKHSDWVIPKIVADVDPEVNKRLDEMETLMNDTDKDGVLDYLDFQNNTPSGVVVDAKGRYIDINKNGTPDEFEPKAIENIKLQNLAEANEKSENDAFKSMLEDGLVNVFYDVNQIEPNKGSANSIYGIISLLKKNPSVNVKLVGYSDKTGSEKINQDLSEQRVKNLYDFLVLSGISESRLKVIGQGVDNSISSDSKTAFQLARRVSILLN